jgi:hypothetical protein
LPRTNDIAYLAPSLKKKLYIFCRLERKNAIAYLVPSLKKKFCIFVGWKGSPRTNAIAYLAPSLKKKVYIFCRMERLAKDKRYSLFGPCVKEKSFIIFVGWKGLPRKNAIAYLVLS